MCREVDDSIDWQWNVNQWGKQANPATAIRHWLIDLPETSDQLAFAWLLYGQSEQPEAVAHLRSCRQLGADHLFETVVAAAGSRPSDLEAAAVHLTWQVHNDPLSLWRADRSWTDAIQGGRPMDRVAAVYHLLDGQSHNANAGQLYRACYRDDAPALFAAVQDLIADFDRVATSHPYLRGDGASPYVIADVVPSTTERSDR